MTPSPAPKGIRAGVRSPKKDEEVRWSDWSAPKHQRKYVTRAEVIQVVNHALNVYRIKHTLFGRMRLAWARWKAAAAPVPGDAE